MPSKSVEDKILPVRFEKIKMMYFSDKMVAANKKDLIFNWFFEQFGSYQHDTSAYVYELLWKTFHDILVAERQNNLTHRILIRSNAVTIFIDAVINYPYSSAWSHVILSSITTFLQTSSVNATLIADIDTLLKILIAALKIICKTWGSKSDEKTINEAKTLANVIFDILENLPSSNEEDKGLIILNSMKDIAIFMHMAIDEKELEAVSLRLTRKMLHIFFNLKTKQFETLLTPTNNPLEQGHSNSTILQFFFSLQDLLLNDETVFSSVPVNVTCATLMKALLSSFLIQNKSSLHSLKVASLFFATAGLDIPIISNTSSCCQSLFQEKRKSVSIVGVSYLLEACLTVPQYFTSFGVPEGYLKPSLWLQNIFTALLNMKISKNKSSWLKCFNSLLRISPTILNNDIVPLIKVTLLNISVHSVESKKQYCELFCTILQIHSKLHQLPKFFVKLLVALTECIKEHSGGKFIANGQILPLVQESIGRCVQELPCGHMTQMWKIFIETFSNLEVMSDVLMSNKGTTFFVAQLISTFLSYARLCEANIPSNVVSQFDHYIELTSAEIEKNILALKDTDYRVTPLRRSVLLLCCALSEKKLAYNTYYGKLVTATKSQLCGHPLDFSVVYSFLNNDYTSVLELYLNGDDKILSVLVFQLLLQKIKVLLQIETLPEEGKSHLQTTVTLILNHLQSSSSSVAAWDMDLCTLNDENYGTAYWKMFLSSFCLDHLSYRDFCTLCCIIQDILQSDSSESGAKSIILSVLMDEYFEASKNFQTAFVSVLWREENSLLSKKRSHDDSGAEQSTVARIFMLLNAYHSKSLKYTGRTPKSNKNLGSIWQEIKEVCDVLNDALLSGSFSKDKLNIAKICDTVKVFSYIPLCYLLPGNQMKCVIGLSCLLFLIPQSCKSSEAVHLVKEISVLLTSICEGPRSIWLFDYVSGEIYLKYIVKTLEEVINDVDFEDNFDWAIQLIEHLISFILKNPELLSGLEHFITELSAKKQFSKTILITYYALLKKLSEVLSNPYKQEKYEILTKVSCAASLYFAQYMISNFQNNPGDHALFIKCYSQVIEIVICSPVEKKSNLVEECFKFLPSVLEVAKDVATNSNISEESHVYLLFVSKVCKCISSIPFLQEDFVISAWKFMVSHLKLKANKIKNCDGNFCVLCSSSYHGRTLAGTEENCKSINDSNINIDKTVLPLTLNELEEASLRDVCLSMTSEALHEVLQNTLEELGSFNVATLDVPYFLASLLALRCLIDSVNDKCLEPQTNTIIQNFISKLHYLGSQVREITSSVCQTVISIPVAEFMSFVVTGNKGLSRQLLFQSLECVSSLSLVVHNNDYELFVKSFSAAWGIVYNLFMHHTAIVQSFPGHFIPYTRALLKSIIIAGEAEPLKKCSPSISQQMQLCAENMNRLLTVISRQEKEFAKLVPYLVADYVDTVQHLTLESSIKDALLSGVCRLLSICNEQSFKTTAVNISHTCREIYINLIKTYNSNKYTGAG